MENLRIIVFSDTFEGDRLYHESAASLQRIGASCLYGEGIHEICYVNLYLTDDINIRQINREQRSIDRSTDVLSFPSLPFSPSQTAHSQVSLLSSEWDPEIRACFLGDIIISVETLKAQANEYTHSVQTELDYLFCHAMLHLLGYDHLNKEDKAIMRLHEETAIAGSDLGQTSIHALLNAARKAKQWAYVPYSSYPVGAALLCEDGTVYTGCNVENASYGLTNCAERTAVFKAVSEGHRKYRAIAIAANDSAPWPCGACRQVLSEFAPDIPVYVTWDDHIEMFSLSALLPNQFTSASLNK